MIIRKVNVTLAILLIIFQVTTSKNHPNDGYYFVFPEYTVEAFSPRGLRVSIPHVRGMELFGFHGNVNKMLQTIDAGDLSKDIVAVQNGRWTFEDRNVFLKRGDTLYFWLYAIKNSLGFKLDSQVFEIKKLVPQPESWRSQRRTTPKPKLAKTTPTPIEDSKECSCPPIQPCLIPISTSTTTSSPAELQPVTPSTTDTIVSIWTGSLNKITEEKLALLSKVDRLSAENEHLSTLLKKTNHPDLLKVLVSGRIPPGGDPEDFARSLLREKLLVKDRIGCVERNDDNSITITLEEFQGKLNVLYAAKEKLKNSQIVLQDLLLK